MLQEQKPQLSLNSNRQTQSPNQKLLHPRQLPIFQHLYPNHKNQSPISHPYETPPFLPAHQSNRQSNEEENIVEMESINKQVYFRDLKNDDEWDQVCYTEELKTHFYRAKKMLGEQFEEKDHKQQDKPRRHKRGASMDLNQLNRRNYASQTLPLRKNKKSKCESGNSSTLNKKSTKKSQDLSKKCIPYSQKYPKAKNSIPIPKKNANKDTLKQQNSKIVKSKHSRWFSDYPTYNRETISSCTNHQKKKQPNKQNKNIVQSKKIVRLVNNSKVTSLKSMDYDHLESTQGQINLQFTEPYNKFSQKNLPQQNYSSLPPKLTPTKEQQQQVSKISQDINKYSKILQKIQSQSNKQKDSNSITQNLVAEYIVKIKELEEQHRIEIQEKQREEIDEFESINLEDNVPSSNVESEVVEKIEASSYQVDNPILCKIEALIGQISTLSELNKIKEEKNMKVTQNALEKSVSSNSQVQQTESTVSFQYPQTLNLPSFVNQLQENSSLIEQKFIQQLLKLQNRYQHSRISEEEYDKQVINLNKWHDLQTRNISKAKNLLQNGLKMAINVIQPSRTNKNPLFQKYSINQKFQTKNNLKNQSRNLNKINKSLCKSMSYLKYHHENTWNSVKEKTSKNGKNRQGLLMKLKEIEVERGDLDANKEENQTPYRIIESDGDSDENSIQEHFRSEERHYERVMIEDEEVVDNNTDSPYSSKQNMDSIVQIQPDRSENEPELYPITTIQARMYSPKGSIPSPPKLQYSLKRELSLEEKEDIIEFLFMDMCLQLEQSYVRTILPSRQILAQMSGQSYVTDDNEDILLRTRLKKAICNENRKKGFNTNRRELLIFLETFKKYLKGEFWDRGQIRSQEEVKEREKYFEQSMIKHLNTPVGPSPQELLKFMRVYNEEQIPFEEPQVDQNQAQQEVTYVFLIEWFDEFSKFFINHYNFGRYYVDEQKQKKRILYLKNALHIHNKAIFDNLNEAADKFRKYGLFGEPFPWKLPPFVHTHVTSTDFSECSFSKKVTDIFKQVEENSMFLCGIFHQKEFSYNIGEYEAAQLREDRLCKMLAKDLVENEPRWLFYDDEETQILVQASDWLFGFVLEQSIQQLLTIPKKP